ncbi:MAG: 3-deoxy-7-phosphoheptulonate synthase, partial [Gammaproteobacteria bacterium]|nr:3-deoxy-7-phosphoheptulonate synthase [Gammaproteobacteria bacterium]
MNNIILCGFKNCGKTTLGKQYAQQYNYHFIDSDALICQHYYQQHNQRLAIRDIHQLVGEQAFRQLEVKAIQSLTGIHDTIIATGGGVMTNPANVNHLKSLGKIIYLFVDTQQLYQRLLQQANLPSFIDKNNIAADFQNYIANRENLYPTVADTIIDTTDKLLTQICTIINTMNINTNTRIQSIKALSSPELLQQKITIDEKTIDFIYQKRQQIEAIVAGRDPRVLAIVGPCSIHDINASLEYAKKLKQLSQELDDALCIVMRVYFEKPRTTIGWKGLIYDPKLNNGNDINHGLLLARQFLLDVNQLGLAAAAEFLDTITPQYIGDLISWAAIGARTTESQIHRNLASGLSMPVG